jgi:hypothetical protein
MEEICPMKRIVEQLYISLQLGNWRYKLASIEYMINRYVLLINLLLVNCRVEPRLITKFFTITLFYKSTQKVHVMLMSSGLKGDPLPRNKMRENPTVIHAYSQSQSPSNDTPHSLKQHKRVSHLHI